MNIFLDTNIILEYFCQRQSYQDVERIMASADDKEHCYVISLGSFYTITYLLEYDFKKKGLECADRRKALREALDVVLDLFVVNGLNAKQLADAINDDRFVDLEDSYQYQVAKAAMCQVIVTINIRDYRQVEDIAVLNPGDFVRGYVTSSSD